MCELIYLSEAKLGQFRPERGRRFRVREIGVPGIGQVGVDPPADSHLDDVVDHLAGIARWYGEDDLATGDWVQFDTSLGYTIFESLVLFAEPPGDRCLVLHGSAMHLLGGVPVTEFPGRGCRPAGRCWRSSRRTCRAARASRPSSTGSRTRSPSRRRRRRPVSRA